ncbi:hypothetical protein F5Y09DRAFT_350962 [Xylaria sp. FL1042]|nr:hypothetical protein F5Y09DRAFT_350962 [Xylaria sp. FL1042]
METVSIFCSRCDHRFGALLNLWTQIGKGYISPIVQAEIPLDISPGGAIQDGEKGTIVDNCRVQGLVCTQCGSTLGSKCLSSAINHVLHEGSLILRASSIQIKDPNSHVTIKPIIQRVLSLKNPPVRDSEDNSHSSTFSQGYSYKQAANDNPRLNHILNEIDAQGEKLEQIDTAGYQIVASFNQSVQHMNETIRNLQNDMTGMTGKLSDNSAKTRSLTDEILSTKTEIEDIKRALQPLTTQGHLEREPYSIKKAVIEANASLRVEFDDTWEKHQQKLSLLGSELENIERSLIGLRTLLEGVNITANAASSATSTNTEEIAALRTELEQLRQELARERPYRSSSTNLAFTPHEIDILTRNITKIGQKAGQVESLQMEFELLKGRLQRMEAQAPTWEREPAAGLQRQEPQHSHSMSQKYNSYPDHSMEDRPGPNTPLPTTPNVRDHDVSWSSSPTTLNSSLSAKASRKAPRVGGQRLTKSGTVDKRCLRKRGLKQAAPMRKASKD